MNPSVKVRPFGSLATGEQVEAWTLTGAGGLILEAITYGGIVTLLLAPDRNGNMADIVLGVKGLDHYLKGHPYFGAITGRVAGRISGGRFKLESQVYQLCVNDPPNHLHGGLLGFDKKLWSATPIQRADRAPSLQLSYCSPDGEEGYPGTVNVRVIYSVTADNAFLIETEASTDKPTPFSLTNHSYFNLAGEGTGSIADHELEIYADEYIPTDEHMTLLGQVQSVAGRPADFRQPRRLGDVIPLLFKNHGDLYRVPHREPNSQGQSPIPIARFVHRGSGRALSVSTTEAYLQFYTGCGLDGSVTGKSGGAYSQYAAACFECEGYPDGANAPSLGNIILRPAFPQHQITKYAFSTIAG